MNTTNPSVQKTPAGSSGFAANDASLFEAFSLQEDGKAKAVEFTRHTYRTQNSVSSEAVANSVKAKTSAEVRLTQLAGDLPILEEAVRSGSPHPLYDSDEPQFPEAWVSRSGVIIAFTALCAIEASTCANIYSFALPVVQSPVAAASMAAPIAAAPFVAKLFTGKLSWMRTGIGVAALSASGCYAWLFARSAGQAGGADITNILGAQLVAETLVMSAISLGIAKLLQPKAAERTKAAFIQAQQEQVALSASLQEATTRINAAKDGENAAALRAEALVHALQEADSDQRTYIAGKSRRVRDLAGSFFASSHDN